MVLGLGMAYFIHSFIYLMTEALGGWGGESPQQWAWPRTGHTHS